MRRSDRLGRSDRSFEKRSNAQRTFERSERHRQNRYFAANCTCRAEPESPVGKRVFVIVPKLVLGTVRMRTGCPRLAVLNRLNTSIRSCTRRVPPIGVFFVIERSTLRNPGPYRAFLGRLPKWK